MESKFMESDPNENPKNGFKISTGYGSFETYSNESSTIEVNKSGIKAQGAAATAIGMTAPVVGTAIVASGLGLYFLNKKKEEEKRKALPFWKRMLS